MSVVVVVLKLSSLPFDAVSELVSVQSSLSLSLRVQLKAGARVIALVLAADLQVVQLPGVALARDDVDGAADRARAGLRGGRAQDLDALDLLRAQRIDRKARRHAVAVEQDLRVAGAQAAKADLPAAARRAAERDAGQALQDLAERGVALALDLVAADDDLRRGRLAALLGVAAAAAGDFDALRVGLPSGAALSVRRRQRARQRSARPPCGGRGAAPHARCRCSRRAGRRAGGWRAALAAAPGSALAARLRGLTRTRLRLSRAGREQCAGQRERAPTVTRQPPWVRGRR